VDEGPAIMIKMSRLEFAPSLQRYGGASFEVLPKGLPQQDAYHLVYRHALAVSPDGRVLAMGSTTGSLWVSESQGQTGIRASAELPPVYAVHWT
jgi:hypothetical protein